MTIACAHEWEMKVGGPDDGSRRCLVCGNEKIFAELAAPKWIREMWESWHASPLEFAIYVTEILDQFLDQEIGS